LYVNGGLVVHRSYDNIVAQNVLYSRYQNQSFRVELQSKGASFYNVAYVLVKFTKFDLQKKEAEFELFYSDSKSEIEIQHIK
jgi:hypothetical protein